MQAKTKETAAGRPSCRARVGGAAFGVLLLLALSACGGGQAGGRVMVLGLDGMDPRVVDLLMSEGKLPHFAKLRQEGAYGRLLSNKPLLSPVIWTTLATGKTPDRHGIGHFTAIDQSTGEKLPVTSGMRRVKALWNILSDQGRKVAVVGWWATWPAETVNGAIVSDHTCYHFLFPEGAAGTRGPEGLTHPPSLAEQLAPIVRRPSDVTLQEASRYIKVSSEEFAQPFAFDHDVGHFRWALATADSYRRIGLKLWQEESPDLLMLYTEGTDSVSHLFGHLFRVEGLSGELAGQQAKFGQAVEQMYLYADRLVGEFLDAMDDQTTLAVMSDHGFELGAPQDDPSKTRDMRRVSERFHREEGILYLYGHGVRRHVRLDRPKLLDVAPTLLALAGLPPARDMPGRVLTEALDFTPPGPRIATYETGAAGTRAASGSNVDPQILERLRALGYLGEDSEGDGQAGAGVGARSPTGERNIAAVLFEQGRYAQSAEIYARLVEESPDDASLRTSLAGALGALGRYDEALEQLGLATELEPLNVEAYHNRAVILERRGDHEGAVAEYRKAVRYNPQYEPSRRALLRLTGSANVNDPSTDGERKAFALAQAASEAARRGAYPEAMRKLEEAESLVPDLVMVHQYRSNIAYLMGDLRTAIDSLETALELEPDNALFKHNLENLRKQADEGGS